MCEGSLWKGCVVALEFLITGGAAVDGSDSDECCAIDDSGGSTTNGDVSEIDRCGTIEGEGNRRAKAYDIAIRVRGVESCISKCGPLEFVQASGCWYINLSQHAIDWYGVECLEASSRIGDPEDSGARLTLIRRDCRNSCEMVNLRR